MLLGMWQGTEWAGCRPSPPEAGDPRLLWRRLRGPSREFERRSLSDLRGTEGGRGGRWAEASGVGARGSGRRVRLAARPSPPLALAALAVSRGHTLVSEAGFPPPPAFAPSFPWALRAGEQWKRGRRWCARGPGALAGRVTGTVRAPASRRAGDASQLRSRAVRPAAAALPFLAGAGTRGGDQRPPPAAG